MFLIFRYRQNKNFEEDEEEEEEEEEEEAGSRSIWITHGRKHGFPLDAEWTLDGWIKGPLSSLSSKGSGGEIFFSFFFFLSSCFCIFIFVFSCSLQSTD